MSLSKKFIGKKYPSQVYEAGKEKIKEYAMAIKNPDPHYLDDEFAARSKYGTIIAPPTFAAVFAARSIGPIFFDPELKLDLTRIVHGEQEFEFLDVVRAGDVLTTGAEILGIENKEKFDLMSVELKTKNQDGKDVCRAVYTLVVRK
jgi:acyl dehydratase